MHGADGDARGATVRLIRRSQHLLDGPVIIDGRKDQVAVVEIDLIGRHAARAAALLCRVSVHQSDDCALAPLVWADAALDARADLAAESRAPRRLELWRGEAGAEAGAQLVVRQVLAN